MSDLSLNEIHTLEFARKQYGVKENYFAYEETVWRVILDSTHWTNVGNEGTPFVIGLNLNKKTEQIRLKVFLVQEWIISEIRNSVEEKILNNWNNKQLLKNNNAFNRQ